LTRQIVGLVLLLEEDRLPTDLSALQLLP
jgi:hypothetical protein